MTVGGMGFIPERLLMMMMMMIQYLYFELYICLCLFAEQSSTRVTTSLSGCTAGADPSHFGVHSDTHES